jgi:hypothetical protein
MTQCSYEGRSIKLRSSLQADGTWFCEYTILEFRPTRSFIESGYPAGSFMTRGTAEAAALNVARSVIDIRDPVRCDPQVGQSVTTQESPRSLFSASQRAGIVAQSAR